MMDRCMLAGILVITVTFSYPSGTHGAFSDIKDRANSLCSFATFNELEAVHCELKGEAIDVADMVQSGASCVVTQGNVDRSLTCKTGVWYDVPAGTPKVIVKRGWWRRRRRRRYTPPPPPPNQPPTITCPTIDSQQVTDARTKTKTVTWGSATATDPENNPIQITQTHGWASGSLFSEGHYSLGFTARDNHNNADVCVKQFEIKVRRCANMPPIPTNGGMSCEPHGYDPLLGTTCSFSCNDGYSLTGSALRTCQSDGTFDGLEAVCSKITCPDLPAPENGQTYCTDGNLYKSVCMTSCQTEKGFGSVGTFILCRYDGTWSGSLQPCYDFRAPYFTECPLSPIKSYANKGQSSAFVSWSPLNATDNSGEVSIVRLTGAAPGSEFSVGSHLISHVARDPSGNESPTACTFTVVVEQLECAPPSGIFDDDLLQVDCPGTEYTYGIQCNLSCVRNYDIIGNTTLTCERDGNTTNTLWYWGGGAQPQCDDKCPDLTPPINGALVCNTASNYYCRQSCNANSGYPRGVSPGQLFICTTSQRWDPPVVDDCTGRKVPDSNIISGEMHYFVGDCNDATVQEGLKHNFITVLETLITDGWNNVCSLSGCSVDNVAVTCGAVTGKKKKSLRWVYQKTSSESSRYKRSPTHVITIDFSVTFPWQNGTSDADLIANDNVLYAVMETLEEEAKKAGGLLVYGGLTPSPDIVYDQYPMITCPAGEIPSYVGGGVNCEGCATGKYFDSNLDDCTVCPIGTYTDESHQTTCKACPTDMSTKDTGRKKLQDCFQVCGAGTYSSNGVIPCTRCAIGTYQSAKHSTGCTRCDVARTTVNRGAVSSSACIAFDVVFGSPGTNIAFPKLTSSLNEFSLMFWLKCPAGSTITPKIHLVNSTAAVEVLTITDTQKLEMFGTMYQITFGDWKHVTITWEETTGQARLLINGNESASIALTGSIATAGTHVEITSNNGSIADCRISGFRFTDTKISDAQLNNDLQTCTPDSTGAIYNMDNFKDHSGVILDTPSKCDVVDECVARPCGIHDCENLLNAYKCICIGGYTGANCDTPPDFCLNNTCKNAAICQNQAWNYTCQCVGDFRGELCEERIVHGQWAKWSDWSQCTVTCSGIGSTGQQARNRTCTNPPPGPDGNECSGSDQEVQACNLEQCPSCKPIGLLLLGARKTVTDYCVTEGGYTRCNLTCETGYSFTPSIPPLDYYECGQNTSYEWNGQPPGCGPIMRGRSITIKTSATYTDTLECGSSTDTALQSSAGNAQCMLDSTCDVTVTTDTCGKRRRKRTTGTTVEMSFVFNLENIGDLNLTAFLESNIISAELQTYLNVLGESDDTADQINSTSGAFFNVIINGHSYTIDPDTFLIESQTACDSGSVDDDGGCVECPSGTRQDGAWCVLCDVGTYQNESGQVLCKQCPTGFTTEFVGMTQEENCSVTAETTTETTSLSTSSATSTSSSTTTATTATTPTSTSQRTTTTTTTSTPSTTTTPTVPTSAPTTTTTVSTSTTTSMPSTATTPTVPTSAPTTTTTVSTSTTTSMPSTTTTPTVPTSAPTTTTTVTTPIITTDTSTTTTSSSSAKTTPTTTTKWHVKSEKFPPNDEKSEGEGLSIVAIVMIGVLAMLVIISAVLAGGVFIYRQRQPVRTTSPRGNQHRRGIDVNIRLQSNLPNTITVAEAGLPPPYTDYPTPGYQKGGLTAESVFLKPLPRKSAF